MRPIHFSASWRIGYVVASLSLIGCLSRTDPSGGGQARQQAVEQTGSVTPNAASGGPSADQVPLDPTTIPRFAHDLAIPRTFAPRKVWRNGQLVRTEYTVSVAQTEVQMLPPGFPTTTVMAYGGNVTLDGTQGVSAMGGDTVVDSNPATGEVTTQGACEEVRTVPGPVFDNTRGIPSLVHWRNEITGPHFLPIDPTLAWANPATMEPPVGPFPNPFPTNFYPDAQAPVGMVTHNHGLVVPPQNDGIAEQWFTNDFQRGPSFVTRDYLKPNDQPSTALFYHDHTMGMTRVSLYSGLAGTAYFIRDPNNPLDAPSSTLPRGKYEIPLVIFDRAFFTDGELNFPRSSTNKKNAYWQPGDTSNVNLVNGRAWPNLNVERRQYRFRALAISNGRLYTLQLDNSGTLVPFTLIGSDGGYLPAPQVVTQVQIATTERADMLVDFSQFPVGTQIILRNAGGTPVDTLGTVMRFTVVDSPVVTPPPVPPLIARPTLTPDAPIRIKTLHNHIDLDGDAQRSVDGLDFTVPPTEFPLVGSTEEWDVVNLGGGPHQIHLHLIEFQLLNRQAIDTAAYLKQWNLLNGHRPVTRPIRVDPTPFLIGQPIAPLPYETGWKDTLRSNPGQVMRLVARWAPQEVPAGGVTPGQNLFPIDPVSTSPEQSYLWHCHVLGHEDNDMMRRLPLVNAWTSGRAYNPGTVVAFQNVDYRVRVAHTSTASQTPDTRFDLWERVNNNDGTWVPQIIYALGDRVLFNGQLYLAKSVHQAQTGQSPDLNPALWDSFPMTACAQITKLCADNSQPAAVTCQNLGAAGVENDCLNGLDGCLAQCDDPVQSPCSGLCNSPTSFTVPDGTTFQSGPLGTGAGCFETESEILTGDCSGFNSGRKLTINGRVVQCDGSNWAYPLPPQRNYGYCIQTTAGNSPNASFEAR